MAGRWRDNLALWGVREWAMTAVAVLVVCAVVLAAGRGLAFGPDGEVMRLRFGGDAQRGRPEERSVPIYSRFGNAWMLVDPVSGQPRKLVQR